MKRHPIAWVIPLLALMVTLTGCAIGNTGDDIARGVGRSADDVASGASEGGDDVARTVGRTGDEVVPQSVPDAPAAGGASLVDDAVTDPAPIVDNLVPQVDTEIAAGTANLRDVNGVPLDERLQEQWRLWAKDTVCDYLDVEEVMQNGLTTDEVVGLITNRLEWESAYTVAQSITDSVNEIRADYVAANHNAMVLSGVKIGLCGF